MLYKTENIPVHAEGFQETTHFDIPASGKAFKSLIDNIYSRKKEAPVRELSTNAFDAHIEAGIDEPFRMKLPTKFDQLFMVRDYGFGMTHDFIMGTGPHKGGGFKSLFKSTKDEDNTQVGMKGLGSKSPFAYTDSFILRIFSGETVRMYSTYLGEDGIPQLAFQGEAESTERRGTAVQFPVQLKDIDDFYEAAVRVLKGFPMLPEGLPRTVLDQLTDVISKPYESGTFWRTYDKKWLGEGAFAKQGCVLYPIDIDKLDNGKWIGNLGQTLIIDFPIGTVQMVDSREMLSYDDETVANINEMADKIKAEIDEKIKTLLAGARTPWELRLLFRNDMFSSLGPLARSSGQYSKVLALNNFMKEALPKRKTDRGTSKAYFYSIVDDDSVSYCRHDDAYSDSLLDNPVFVYIGLDPKKRKSMNQRSKLLLEQSDEQISGVVLLERLSLKLHRKLGKPKIMRVSDLPEKPKAERGERAPVVWDRFKQFNGSSSPQVISEDDLETLKDEGTKFVYIFQNKGSCLLPVDGSISGATFLNSGDLYLADSLLRKYRDTRIIAINVRGNEKLTRWPEADFPRFDPESTVGILRTLGKTEIKPLINYINGDRFEYSVYAQALDQIEDYIPKMKQRGFTNPLFDLTRFKRRKEEAVSQGVRYLINRIGDQGEEDIIERALELGLEVLPEQLGDRWSGGKNRFAYPLLSAKWERITNLFGASSEEKRDAALLTLILGGTI